VGFFTVPTIRVQVLYVLLVWAHVRRRIVHVNVTAHRTAAWRAQQPHISLAGQDTPERRTVQLPELGRVFAIPLHGGLHHRYERRAA
jgi:hypothetical protein